jgi:3-hydroxyethyl bacteriochlorophyllide a dehydrogenase
MKSSAIVFDQPQHLSIQSLELAALSDGEVQVEVEFSGISTGTERALWDGSLPTAYGMSYPLVPGYESVGRVVKAAARTTLTPGDRVFVPGADCLQGVRSWFGGAASHLVVPQSRIVKLDSTLGQEAVLLAMAATAYHAVAGGGQCAPFAAPELIIGHGVMGRLLARLTVAAGGPAPTVWETAHHRQSGAIGYNVVHPSDDDRQDYQSIYDVSGDSSILDLAIARLAKNGQVVLAGFYKQAMSFHAGPALQREAHIRTASNWRQADLLAVTQLAHTGQLSLEGLITHAEVAAKATNAYDVAFGDTDCLKMILDWRHTA